jgi:hypothetical protein
MHPRLPFLIFTSIWQAAVVVLYMRPKELGREFRPRLHVYYGALLRARKATQRQPTRESKKEVALEELLPLDPPHMHKMPQLVREGVCLLCLLAPGCTR